MCTEPMQRGKWQESGALTRYTSESRPHPRLSHPQAAVFRETLSFARGYILNNVTTGTILVSVSERGIFFILRATGARF